MQNWANNLNKNKNMVTLSQCSLFTTYLNNNLQQQNAVILQ